MSLKMKQMKKDLVNLVEFQSAVPVENLDVVLSYLGKGATVRVEPVTTENYPLVYAVNRGSKNTSYVVHINEKKDSKIVLVGKGVVYDSGGLYLKPDPWMNDMFNDKYGAMLTTVIAKTEGMHAKIFLMANLVSETSMLNGEVIVSRDGTRVINEHSDAEGRLGLADVISKVREDLPDADIVTLATLTGAAVYFVGPGRMALLHTPDLDLQKLALELFMNEGMQIFPAPLHKTYDDSVKARQRRADITNAGSARSSGSQAAYSFLKHFAGSKLHHMDIAALGADENGDIVGEGISEVLAVIKHLKG